MESNMIEFLGDTLLVIIELFPYGAIGLLGYAWGDYNANKICKPCKKQMLEENEELLIPDVFEDENFDEYD